MRWGMRAWRNNSVLDDLQKTFGYRPNEDDGEKWVVYRDHSLIVTHHDRRPIIFMRGGVSYQIEPELP